MATTEEGLRSAPTGGDIRGVWGLGLMVSYNERLGHVLCMLFGGFFFGLDTNMTFQCIHYDPSNDRHICQFYQNLRSKNLTILFSITKS